jgi:glutaminyl-peptide cyclotransferase
MMLDLAEVLTPLLNTRQHQENHKQGEGDDISDTTLQLIFFDGEEAFREWTDTDSIYGSRFAFLFVRLLVLDIKDIGI